MLRLLTTMTSEVRRVAGSGLVIASVPGPSQMRQVDDQRLGRGVDGSATAVAMCQSRRAAFTVGRQDAAGVAGSTPINSAAWSKVMCSAARLLRT